MKLQKLKNVLWLISGKFSLVFFSAFTFIFFALYLTPEELGTGALAIALVELVSVFYCSMIETPLATKESVSDEEHASTFWLGGAGAIVLSAVLVGVVYIFSSTDLLVLLVAFGTLKFVFSAISRPYIATFRIRREFKSLTIRTLFGKIVGAVVAISFAVKGAGEFSVVIQPVVMEVVSFAILAKYAGIPKFRSNYLRAFMSIIAQGYAFALKVSFSTILERMTIVVLSITTSMELVGYYAFTRRLVGLPRAALQSAIETYSIPVFATRVSKKANVSHFFKEISTFTYIIFGAGFMWFGLVFSELLVPLFGEKWAEATNLFLALSFIAAFRLIDVYISPLLAAYKHSKVGLGPEILNSLFCLFVVWGLSTMIGLWGAVIATALHAVLSLVIRFSAINRFFSPVSTIKTSLLCLTIMLSISLLAIYINELLALPLILNIGVSLCAFLIYLMIILLTQRNFIVRLKTLVH